MLPKELPPRQAVYWWFRCFVRPFMFQTIHDVALMLDRELSGRETSPTDGVIDSPSVKAPETKTTGCGAGKKTAGRKRHISELMPVRMRRIMSSRARADGSAQVRMRRHASASNSFSPNKGASKY
jgi:putative transposase